MSILSGLCRLYFCQGQLKKARDYAHQALSLAKEAGGQADQLFIYNLLGQTHTDLNQPQMAEKAYLAALDIAQATGLDVFAKVSWAGLAALALANGRYGQALASIENILTFLQDKTLNPSAEPMFVFVQSIRVLNACNDQRVHTLLAYAHDYLHTNAKRIQDQALYSLYLHQERWNRVFLKLHQEAALAF